MYHVTLFILTPFRISISFIVPQSAYPPRSLYRFSKKKIPLLIEVVHVGQVRRVRNRGMVYVYNRVWELHWFRRNYIDKRMDIMVSQVHTYIHIDINMWKETGKTGSVVLQNNKWLQWSAPDDNEILSVIIICIWRIWGIWPVFRCGLCMSLVDECSALCTRSAN